MQLEWLEEFVKVASTQSITQAAVELNLTQPCLSKHMRNLEEAVGGDLLVRNNVRTTLTPLGKILLSQIRGPLFDLREAIDSTRAVRRARASRVRVESFVPYHLLDDLIYAAECAFVAERALVEIEVHNVEAHSPLDDVREGLADVAFVQLSRSADLSGLDSVLVFTEPMTCIVAAAHPLASYASLDLSDLNGQTICFYSDVPANEHNALIREILAAGGVSYKERSLPWDRNARDGRNYRLGDGVLLETASHIEYDIPRHALTGLRAVPFGCGGPLLPMAMVYRSGEGSWGVLEFVEKVLAGARDLSS